VLAVSADPSIIARAGIRYVHVFVRMRIHLALALARGPASGAIAIAIVYRKTMVEAWKGGSAAPHDPPLDPPLSHH